jgi:hypothetical protein
MSIGLIWLNIGPSGELLHKRGFENERKSIDHRGASALSEELKYPLKIL